MMGVALAIRSLYLGRGLMTSVFVGIATTVVMVFGTYVPRIFDHLLGYD
jgi:putative Mn2+ efflux pump MntP